MTYECSLWVQCRYWNRNCYNKICVNCLHSEAVGTLKHCPPALVLLMTNKPPCETFTTKYLVACYSHLSGCFWFFVPKFWEVEGTYKFPFCLTMNAAWVVWTIIGGGDTQLLLIGKKKLNFMHLGWWGCKNFVIFPSSQVLLLVPHTSHLVKLSLPNIFSIGYKLRDARSK